jgi:hypothetical protein
MDLPPYYQKYFHHPIKKKDHPLFVELRSPKSKIRL